MNSGCICCSLVGDFGTALQEVVETYHPDRIIIEPSGVGKLSDVIHAVERVQAEADLQLNSATTVVDVTKCKMYLKNFGEFFKNQVEAASTIILSRTDLPRATPEKVEEALKQIRELNPDVTVITTPVEDLGGKKVLETMEGRKIDLSHVEEEQEHHHGEHEEHHHHHAHEEHHHHHHEEEHDHEHGECCGHDHHHDHHHHHADEVFQSWGRETIHKFEKAEIEEILQKLSADDTYGTVLRAKGMVEGTDGHWIYFDMVPEEADVREGAPEYTGRLCVIGAGLHEEKLEELFGI